MRKEKHCLCFRIAIVQKPLGPEDNIRLYRTNLLIITPSAESTQNAEGTKKNYMVLFLIKWYFSLLLFYVFCATYKVSFVFLVTACQNEKKTNCKIRRVILC